MATDRILIRCDIGLFERDTRKTLIEFIAGFNTGDDDSCLSNSKIGRLNLELFESPEPQLPKHSYTISEASGLVYFFDKSEFTPYHEDQVLIRKTIKSDLQQVRIGNACPKTMEILSLSLLEINHLIANEKNTESKLFLTTVYERLYGYIRLKRKQSKEFQQ